MTPSINIHSGASSENEAGNLSSSGGGASPRSVSPKRVADRVTRTADLLNLDDSSSHDNDSHTEEPSINPTNNLESDFGLLLDLGETTAAATPTAPKSSDLESLLGGLGAAPQPTSSATVTPTNPTNLFDPFGTFDVPSGGDTFVKPTPVQPNSNPPKLGTQKSQNMGPK